MAEQKQEIFATLERHRDRLRCFGVRRLGLFGSAVRGELSDASDLDFLVEFEHKTFDAYMDTKELLESAFGRRVDLVIPDALKARLKPGILAEVEYAQGF